MKTKIIIFILLFASCNQVNKLVLKNQEFHIVTVNNNVCKRLLGEVVLYAVFVDSKTTSPWTQYDINSTLDSIKLAIKWIEEKAEKADIPLKIELEYFQDNNRIIPIKSDLSKKTLSATINSVNGVKNVDKWADKIAQSVLKSMGPDTSAYTRTKIMPTDRERLIARLRDIYKTDNVALIYFINNYYKDESSVAIHTSSQQSVEYAILSFKNPAVIAHEFLHIFGALDLYITPFDNDKKMIKRKAFAMKEFPDEIMAFPYRNLASLNISPFTKYLLGWNKILDENYKQMLIGKKIKIASY